HPPPAGAVGGGRGPEQAQFFGDATCTSIGTRCAIGEPFATDLPAAGAIAYVHPLVSMCGEGTRARAFNTIDAPLASVPAGAIIALASGTYFGPFVLERGEALW